jgi:hypothetical protein
VVFGAINNVIAPENPAMRVERQVIYLRALCASMMHSIASLTEWIFSADFSGIPNPNASSRDINDFDYIQAIRAQILHQGSLECYAALG